MMRKYLYNKLKNKNIRIHEEIRADTNLYSVLQIGPQNAVRFVKYRKTGTQKGIKNDKKRVFEMEHLPYKQGVSGSNPLASTKLRRPVEFLHEFLHEFFNFSFHGL